MFNFSDYLAGVIVGTLGTLIFTTLFRLYYISDNECASDSSKDLVASEEEAETTAISAPLKITFAITQQKVTMQIESGNDVSIKELVIPTETTSVESIKDVNTSFVKKIKTAEELDNLFNKASQVDDATPKTPPVSIPTAPIVASLASVNNSIGGYRVFNSLGDNHLIVPFMKKEVEREIMYNMTAEIVGKSLQDATEILKNKGYNIHVLYVGMGPKTPLRHPNEKTIGVRIDSKSNVREIIDVGGVDTYNRGVIGL
jgi:hypothetical protein